jgi:putative ABC transport system permease protein
MNLSAVSNALALGALFSLMAAGLYLSFRIVRFPDLTCDGSYSLGACTTAALVSSGFSATLTIPVSAVMGFLAGVVTGWMYTKLRFPPVICGILTMTASYSVNLIIMGGRPNLPIRVSQSLFAVIEQSIRGTDDSSVRNILFLAYPLLLIVFSALTYFGMRFLLASYTGLKWRALGINSNTASRNGVNVTFHLPLALGTANGLIGLAGGLMIHHQRFADINMGNGILMVGLASLFMGQACEQFQRKLYRLRVGWQMFWVFLCSFLYHLIVSTAYDIGLPTTYFNLLTAGLVFLALLSPATRGAWLKTFGRS